MWTSVTRTTSRGPRPTMRSANTRRSSSVMAAPTRSASAPRPAALNGRTSTRTDENAKGPWPRAGYAPETARAARLARKARRGRVSMRISCFARPSSSDRSSLPEIHADHLVRLAAARCRHLHGVAHRFAHQGPGDRRGNRHAAGADVGFGFADDLVGPLLLGILVEELDRGAELDAIAGKLADVDDLGAGDQAFELQNPALVVGLGLLRGVVLRIFRQVALGARLGDRLNDAGTLHLLTALEFLLQRSIALDRQRDLVH